MRPSYKQTQKQDDDWDFEDKGSAIPDNGVRAANPPTGHSTTGQGRPRTAAYGGSAHGLPKRGTRKQAEHAKKAHVIDNDVDELDDMMGLGAKNDFFEDTAHNQDKAEDRDPLDFMKKADQNRKAQEEERKRKQEQAVEDFKLIKDL